MESANFSREGRAVIELERDALEQLAQRLDDSFDRACQMLMACSGRIVVSGMGKSGHIGRKIAATLASTGSPAFFVHPGEASHGDLGMILSGDVIVIISHSGETPEILTILPLIKRIGAKLIVLTGSSHSTIGQAADICLDVSVMREACPLNLTPTASTTTALAMGDALAVAILNERGFGATDFGDNHPGGILGRRALIYVRDIMHSQNRMPLVNCGTALPKALVEMSSKGLGMTGVVDKDGKLVGIFTDGDLRRALNQSINLYDTLIDEVMTAHPRTTSADALAAETVVAMREGSINGLFAINDAREPIGALNILDLVRAGIF